MNAKKVKKVDSGRMDLEDLKPDMGREFDVDETDSEETEEETKGQAAGKKFQVNDLYAHVYERVTNGGKVVAVVRQGGRVTEISRTHNWVEVEVDGKNVRGFLRPAQLVEVKEEVDG